MAFVQSPKNTFRATAPIKIKKLASVLPTPLAETCRGEYVGLAGAIEAGAELWPAA
jgi:hypothetical protein